MSYLDIKRRLDAGEIVVLDGGTGTELQRRGAQMDPSAWCGPASLNNSELLTQVHLDYIEAGADVITANTFASSRLMLTPAGFANRVEEINRIAVEAALRARDLATAKSPSRKIAVAGSLSHMVPVAAGTAKVDPVVLPQPEGPTSTRNSLSATSRVKFLTAATSPNRFVTPSKCTFAIVSYLRGKEYSEEIVTHFI